MKKLGKRRRDFDTNNIISIAGTEQAGACPKIFLQEGDKIFETTYWFKAEVTNMRPANILARPVAYTLELSFPRLIITMRHQKLNPLLNYARM